MSRSNYSDDFDGPELNLWRGAVASAIRGRRGQAFLQEMLAALDSIPEKKLVHGELESEGEVCAIGSVGKARGIDMSKLDPEDSEKVAATFGIAEAMAREVVFMNDEAWWGITDEQRFEKIRGWIVNNIHEQA